MRVDDAEGRVAVAHVVDEQADGVDVVDLAELRALALHLLPDAVDVLRPALDVGLDAGRLELGSQLGDRPLDVASRAPLRRVSRSLASSRKRSGSSTLNARSSSSHLICQMPSRSASGA